MLQRTPGTLLDFAAWLETKNPTEKYVWDNWQNCACAQYFKERLVFEEEWVRHAHRHDNLNSLARRAAWPRCRFWFWHPRRPSFVGTFGDLLNLVHKELNAQ